MFQVHLLLHKTFTKHIFNVLYFSFASNLLVYGHLLSWHIAANISLFHQLWNWAKWDTIGRIVSSCIIYDEQHKDPLITKSNNNNHRKQKQLNRKPRGKNSTGNLHTKKKDSDRKFGLSCVIGNKNKTVLYSTAGVSLVPKLSFYIHNTPTPKSEMRLSFTNTPRC